MDSEDSRDERFDRYLDSQGDVEINGTAYSRSDLLYQFDRSKYDELFDEWAEDRFEEAYRVLRKYDGNRRRFYKLISRCSPTNIVVPFVGAGLSIPNEFPGWTDFVLRLATRHLDSEADEVSEWLNNGHHVEVIDEILGCISEERFKEYVLEAFRSDDGLNEVESWEGPVDLLPKLFTNGVVTTNLDRILETVYRKSGSTFVDTAKGGQCENFLGALAQFSHRLLKVHGDIRAESSWVLTSDDYNGVYGSEGVDFNRHLPASLRRLYLSRHLLFLGCSLSQDRTVDLFGAVYEDVPPSSIPRHYAILERSDDAEDQAEYLEGKRIFPIWYESGQHKQVQSLLKLLYYEVEGEVI